ncbi:hypothetical protein Taro_025404 [Colocasia esculenta]|uniref:Uncharacterized protein n=1 Tax=Colocasia esculenta TaxID=4460 RepID=A0A843VHG9_COLES|nr:hypothetical protein [Colocasia esculenta]
MSRLLKMCWGLKSPVECRLTKETSALTLDDVGKHVSDQTGHVHGKRGNRQILEQNRTHSGFPSDIEHQSRTLRSSCDKDILKE